MAKTGDAEAFRGLVMVQAGSLDDEKKIDEWEVERELWVTKRVGWLKRMQGKEQCREFS